MRYKILLEKIAAINQLVLESRTLKDERRIFQKFVDTARKILEADYGYSFLWDQTSKSFKIFYLDNQTPFVSQVPRKKGVTATAFRGKKPVFVNHAEKTLGIRSDAKKFMKGVVIIPVVYGSNRYGVIDICFNKPHQFTQEEKILCEYIGNSASQAITIERKENELLNLMKKKDEFFNIASHELKTPITTIKGFTQLLGQSARSFSKGTARYISKINAKANKLEQLVNDLLDISRIETGKIRFEEKKVNLMTLLKRVVEDMKVANPNHEIILVVKDKTYVKADERLIERVVINLINNAAKYSPEKSKIIVSLKSTEHNAEIGVEDSGYGIDHRNRSKVFKRFFQGDQKKKLGLGLGLGLYISKEIIKHHRGNIDFIPAPKGQGTLFFFTIPEIQKNNGKY